MFLRDIVSETLQRYSDANLGSRSACDMLAEVIENEYNKKRMEWFCTTLTAEENDGTS
jgi:hypothetical protein